MTKESPPAHAIPDPTPPKIALESPFSNVPERPEKSAVFVKQAHVRSEGVALIDSAKESAIRAEQASDFVTFKVIMLVHGT
jgi:hypothetical protein